MKTLFFFAAALVAAAGALAGCGTDPTTGSTQVEGQVVESQGRRPVAGAAVQVYHKGSGGGYGEVGDPQPADAQGRFSFHFEATSKSGYLVGASAPPGYVTSFQQAPRLTAGRNNTGLVVPMYAPAWVRLVLIDEAPTSRVMLNINGYSGSGEQLRYPKDTILVRPILSYLRTNISWFIYEAGVPDKASNQDIQPAALDTATVRIRF